MNVRFRLGLAALFAALAVGGCASAEDADTLTIWHSWGGAELRTLKSLIADFERKHPGIDVVALQIPHDTLLDKYTRSSAANGGPDILIGDNDWSGKLSQAGLVVPIFDEQATTATATSSSASVAPAADPDASPLFPLSDEARFAPETLAALRVGHEIYAWPESVETLVLYYNKAWVPRPPATMTALRTMAAGLHIPDGYALAFNTDFYYFAGYFFGGGGQIFAPDGKLDVDTPAGVDMLGWLAGLTTAPGVLGTHDYGKADSLYKEGKAAMIVNGPWALADYQKALGPDLGIAPLPRLSGDRPPRPWIGVKCLMVNSDIDARHLQLARSFLAFIDEPSTQRELSMGCGHIPAVLGVKVPADSPLAVFERQARTGTPKSADPHLALVWDPMNRAIQETLSRRYPPAVALARTQKLIEAELAEVEANE